MYTALDCKPHDMMKKNISRGLQSNKYGNDKRKHIMSFIAQELPMFSSSSCKTYSISVTPGHGFVKNSSVAHRLRNPVKCHKDCAE